MRRALLSLFALSLACGAPSAKTPPMPPLDAPVAMRTTPDDPMREHAPEVAGEARATAPKVVERKLPNGIRVLFVERHHVPALSIRVISDRGADQADSGIGELWTRAVLRASTEHQWWDVNDALNDLGIEWRARVAPDWSELQFEVLSKLAEPAIDWLGELICKPAFLNKFLERGRQRLDADLHIYQTQAAGQLELLVHRTFFPVGHRYHWPSIAPENLYRIELPLLEAYHRLAFTPAHMTIVVAGDEQIDTLYPMLVRAFGGLAGPTIGAQAPPPAPPALADEPRFIVIDAPQETQAHVAFAWLGPPRYSEGFVALGLAIEELSDAMLAKLRREKSVTYGVHSAAPLGRGHKPITFETALDDDRVGEAVSDVMKIVKSRAVEPISAASLADLRGQFLFQGFETLPGTTASIARLPIYARPLDWYDKAEGRLAAVSPEDVRVAFERHLPFDRMRVLVVGNAAKISPQLSALGAGTVQVRKRIVMLP